MEPDPAQELADLYPEPIVVELKAGSVTLRPLTIMELGKITRALSALFAALVGQEQFSLPALLEDHAAELVQFTAAVSGRDPAWIRRLSGGDFIRLTAKALEANDDFFVQCFDLLSGQTGSKLARLLGGLGPMLSTSSAPTGIPTANGTPPLASGASSELPSSPSTNGAATT